jgi:putative ABC transport system permease protein
MFSVIRLAIRNVGRNRRRSILAFVSVAISLTVIVFAQGFIGGFVASYVGNATRNDAGHVRIAAKKFEERSRFFPVTYPVKNPDSIIATLQRDPLVAREIALSAQRITFGVLLSKGNATKSAIAMAGEPAKEDRLFDIRKSLLPGSRSLAAPRDMVMGADLARELAYRLGDTVRVMTSGADYALHLKKFVLTGVFKTGLKLYDDALFRIGISDARDLLRMGDATQQIIFMLHDYTKAGAAAARMRARVADTSIAVTPWTAVGDTYRSVLLVTRIYNIIYIVIALLGAFIISNIMMMVVLERRREIGILTAMGFKRGEILAMFLVEGMTLVFVGSAAGVLLGWALVAFFHTHGIDLTMYMSKISLPLDNVIYTRLSAANVVYSLVLGTALAALVSLAPARQAAGMNAVDAIKSV